MEKPEKPLPSECCGGGACCPCVWDDYFDKLEAWQKLQEQDKPSEKPDNKVEQDESENWYR